MIEKECDHNSYAGGWHNIRHGNDKLECGGCHEIIEERIDITNNPLKFENVDVEIIGWSPTQIIIRKDGSIIDFIEVHDEGGYEGAYNVYNARNLAAIKRARDTEPGLVCVYDKGDVKCDEQATTFSVVGPVCNKHLDIVEAEGG